MSDPTSRLAVLGSPIGHSRSPKLHRAAYAALGLDWEYGRQELTESGLEAFLSGLEDDWRGFSLTMPLKRRAYELADDRDRIATITGNVNTLRRSTGGRLSGFNTDVAGIVNAITEIGIDRPRDVVVLGAGNTATSAVAAAAELGAEQVHVAVREPRRALQLGEFGASVGLRMSVGTFSELDDFDTATLVISTLPGGVRPEVTPSADLRSASLLFDVAYDPWPSVLAEAWVEVGGTAVSGLTMLLHQALAQVRIFVSGDPLEPLDGEAAALAAMRSALD